MRVFFCLAFLVVAACGNDESLSLTRDGGSGNGGLDGSMNDRDMAVPVDMTVRPDMTTPIDMSVAPTRACIVDGTIALGFAEGASILDAALTMVPDEAGNSLPAIAFVREGADGAAHVYLTRYSANGTTCAWTTPELVSGTDVLSGTALEAPLAIEFDEDSRTFGIAYGKVEAGAASLVLRTRALSSGVVSWGSHALGSSLGGDAQMPALGAARGTFFVAHTAVSATCLNETPSAREMCRRVVLTKVDARGLATDASMLMPMPHEGTIPGEASKLAQAAKLRPSIAFDDRGELAIAAFFEMNRQDTSLHDGKLMLWRAPWNDWEYTNTAGDALLDPAQHPALALNFDRGIFTVAFRANPEIDWYDGEGIVTSPGLYVISRGPENPFGSGSWGISPPLLADDAITSFGDSVALLVDAQGKKTVVAQRVAAEDDVLLKDIGPLVLRRTPGGSFDREEVLDRMEIEADGFDRTDFVARPFASAIDMLGRPHTLFIGPESATDGAPYGLWMHRAAALSAPPPCGDGDWQGRFAEFRATRSDVPMPGLFSKVILDTDGEPVVVVAELDWIDDGGLMREKLVVSAYHYTRLDPEIGECSWKLIGADVSESVIDPSSSDFINAQQIAAVYDATRQRVLVAFPQPSVSAMPVVRFVAANLESAYGTEAVDVEIDGPTGPFGPNALTSMSVAIAEDRIYAAAGALLSECPTFECILPVVVEFEVSNPRGVLTTSDIAARPLVAIPIDRTGYSGSVERTAYPRIAANAAGNVYVSWMQRGAVDGEYTTELVLARHGVGEPFASATVLSIAGDAGLRGGAPRFDHANTGAGTHLFAMASTSGYAILSFAELGSTTMSLGTLDLPGSTQIELLEAGGDATLVGMIDREYAGASADRIGAYVAPVSTGMIVRPDDRAIDPPSGTLGAALGATYDGTMRPVVSYAVPRGISLAGGAAVAPGFYVERID